MRISFQLFIAACLTVALVSSPALADTSLSSNNECASTANATSGVACGNVYSPDGTAPSIFAARSDPGSAAAPIDVWGTCRYIDNISTTTSLFVPFKSKAEWQAFILNAPNVTISLQHCSRSETLTIPADSNCLPVAPATSVPPQSVTLPYARYNQTTNAGVTQTETANFSCADASGNKWTETATATYTGLDSDSNSPSWKLQGIVYSGSPPVSGACGSSNGTPSASAPTTNLCSAGNPTSVYGSGGYWNWTCMNTGGSSGGGGGGKNGGSSSGLTNASCSAAQALGQCGSANGQQVSSAPASSQLCNSGKASTVSYSNGTWSWSCTGTSTNQSCSSTYSTTAWPSCFLGHAPNKTISSSTSLGSTSGSYILINGSNMNVTFGGTIQNCIFVTGANNTIDIGPGDQNSITVTGNSNNLIASNGALQDQDGISMTGTNETVNMYAIQNGVSIYGNNAHVTQNGGDQNGYYIYGDYAVTSLSNDDQDNVVIRGNYASVTFKAPIQDGATIYGDHATITDNSYTYTYSYTDSNGVVHSGTAVGSGDENNYSINGDYGSISVGGVAGSPALGGSIADGSTITGNFGTITIAPNSISDGATINGTSAAITIGAGETSTGSKINGHGTITRDGTTTTY